MDMKRIKIFVAMIVLPFVFWSCQDKQQQNGSEINLYAVLPLTGNVASYGNDSKDGIDLAIELANKSQTKYKFRIEYQDTKGDTKTAVTILERIFSTSKPTAIIGENTSSATASMIPIADKYKTLLISPSASAPNLSQKSSYFFRVFPSDIEEGIFISNVISKNHPNAKICIVYANNDYGTGLKEVFEQQAKSVGLNVLQCFGYSTTNNDFKSILTTVKSLNPDVIYMPGYYKDGAIILKQAKELKLKSAMYGSTTHEDPKLIEIAGIASEGFMYPVSTGFDINSNDSIVSSFIHNFTIKYHKEPGLVSALGYDCAQLIIESVLKKGISTDSIKNYIITSKDIHGSAGVMNFDSNGDVHKPIILKTIKDGKFQIY
jgi:branched-chain amino acid transport system substrate-binding protein